MSDISEEKKAKALETIGEIYMAFGFSETVPDVDSELYPLIVADRLRFDASSEVVTFVLSAPITLKNEQRVTEVTFKEPAASELEYIRKGISVGDSSHVFSLGDLVTLTLRALVKTGGVITGVADRIKSRDIDTIAKVMTELGFFFR